MRPLLRRAASCDEPRGRYASSAPVGLGELRLNGLFLEFLKEYPQIDIETILVDRMVDLVEDGIDVAIRLGDRICRQTIARRLAELPRVLVGSPGYLKEAPALQRPEDVKSARFYPLCWPCVGRTADLLQRSRKYRNCSARSL